MARPRNNPIENEGLAGPPMPPQQVVDQLAAQAPQLTPEEMLNQSPPRPKATIIPQVREPQREHVIRPMFQIIQQFVAEVANHPDGKMLSSAIGGTPEKQQQFADTASKNQHKAEIRLVWRDPMPTGLAPQQAERGWKYAGLIAEMHKQQTPVRNDRVAPVAPNPAWAKLIEMPEHEAATP